MHRKLKKVLKIIGIVIVAALLLIIVGTFINHRTRSAKEIKLLKEQGYYNPVSVGDYSLNVSIFGNVNGNHTIVGLAGLGVGNFSVSARAMTASLEEDNKLVFIDRAGYGFSDDTNNEMTLEYIVEDYRKALLNAGIEGPYILMGHSEGGVYATYWESIYPEEIEAVIFVDGTMIHAEARSDEVVTRVTLGDRIKATLAKIGFSKGDVLTRMTDDSIAPVSEIGLTAENDPKAFNSIVPNNIPKLYICAFWGIKTKEELIELNKWKNEQNNLSDEYVEKYISKSEQIRNEYLYPYTDKMGNCQVVCLGGDHMIYEQKPKECGALIKEFIEKLIT